MGGILGSITNAVGIGNHTTASEASIAYQAGRLLDERMREFEKMTEGRVANEYGVYEFRVEECENGYILTVRGNELITSNKRYVASSYQEVQDLLTTIFVTKKLEK